MTRRVLVARLDGAGDVLLAGPAVRAVALLAMAVTVLVAALFVVGVVVERSLIEPLRRRAGREWLLDSFVLTIGLMYAWKRGAFERE